MQALAALASKTGETHATSPGPDLLRPPLGAFSMTILEPGFRLQLNPSARLLIGVEQTESLPILAGFCANGRSTQCGDGTADSREIVLGLDFGTSSVKTVIGDSALGKAFAVPFREGDGVKRYLLPSRLYETASRYSFDGGGTAHRDLKLALIADLEILRGGARSSCLSCTGDPACEGLVVRNPPGCLPAFAPGVETGDWIACRLPPRRRTLPCLH